MGMTNFHYEAEALNQAIHTATEADTPETIVARAQVFKDFLDGKTGNTDQSEEQGSDDDEPDTLIIKLNDAEKAWMTHQNAIALEEFAKSESIRLGWDGSLDLTGNYMLGIQEAAKFLRGERLYSDGTQGKVCHCIPNMVQVNSATEDVDKVAAEVAAEALKRL